MPGQAEVWEFRRRLLNWYAEKGRDFSWRSPTASLYEQVISEVLLQRTTATAVAAYLPRFLTRFPDWGTIESTAVGDLEHELRPVGLWKRRAESMKRLATAIIERNLEFPRTRAEIEALPGIGQYIASAVLLFRYGQAEPLLDTNMARVLERYFGPRTLADIRYDPYLQRLAKASVDGPYAKEVNWAILDLAALVCRRVNPLCADCPLTKTCRTGKARLGESAAVT